MTRAAGRVRQVPPQAAVLAVAVAASLAVGCRGEPTALERTPLEVDDGGGGLIRMAELRTSTPPLRADRLCTEGPGLEAATLLECELVPLLDPAASRCDSAAPVSADRLCEPPDVDLAAQLLGWVVTEPEPGRRAVTIVTGAASPGVGAAPESTSTATLERRYVAQDGDGAWSELAVCPRDVDGNGAVDLVVFARSTDPDRIERPEVVVVSLFTARRSGRSAPSLQSAVAERDVPRAAGEGCTSPMVEHLEADGRSLHLNAPA